jgi:hypothetical protein
LGPRQAYSSFKRSSLRGRFDLGEEAFGAERGAEIFVQDLDRDVSIV